MKKSWTIKDGVLPESLRADMQDIADRQTVFDTGGTPTPPWTEFPKLARGSMGWRMGAGEDYMMGFRKWFSQLDAPEQKRYASLHPEPDDWSGFYTGLTT